MNDIVNDIVNDIANGSTDGERLDEAAAEAYARQLIEHLLGTAPREMQYQSSGLTNFVFLVEHAAGGFAVRLSPDPGKINAFIKEQWAVAAAREAGVPAPEILEVGNEVIPFPYMIARRAPGQEATGHADRSAILRKLGEHAAQINSIPTVAYGRVFDWSSNQLSRCESWPEYLTAELKLEERLATLERLHILDPAKISVLRKVLESAAEGRAPVLNHGDLRLKNVMVDDDGAITAIIDWETCVSSIAPEWELSIALHDLSIDDKDDFIKGYGLFPKAVAAMAPTMAAINLINYAPRLRSLEERGDTEEIDRLRARLSGALDLYSF